MVRLLALSFAILLAAQTSPAFAQVTSIKVAGQLAGGYNVSVVCSVSNTGAFSGSGALSAGYTSYPFAIKQGSTTSGKLVLTGNFTVGGGYPVTVSASVPNGPLTFSYIVNGQVIVMNGVGTVTAK